ncbi:sensor histidine kinase [Cellulosimicrobium protaetiae]|uniref:histidine kinase n=1 Tax=Cellulosimicrobium protaetiae TaxID=2587808 RepID=A0A6M5ULQ7_9MICO|nr:histidine kinase [Cellulosimicrobium protaetiae]QJW38068.1 two-component sensor histidine kinase [Cellulosimicrobium protaetiae]
MSTEDGSADEARPVASARSGRWRAATRSLSQVWRIEDRRNDVFSAVMTFVLGWVLLEVGLVGLVRAPFVVEPAEPWWRVALLGVGCLLILVKRAHPILALLGGVAVTAVDIRWGGSLAITLVLWDLLYAAALWSGPRARAWLWGVAVTVAVLGSVGAGEAARDVRQFVYMGLQLGAVLLVPMWWATNVRTKSELAELAGERADLAAREAEAAARTADLERQRASDLERIAELDRHEAVRAERAAMARDLHDVIASHLSTIAIHSGAALALPPDATKDRAALEQVRVSAVASLDEMRSMILLLRTEGRRDDDAGPAVDAVAAPGRLAGLDALLDAARATTTVTLDDPGGVATSSLPAAADQALFRIAQEAVTNALKHAPGSPVTVRLARHDAAVALEVRDDGAPRTAPPVEGPLSAGTGLLTMRERADGLGGTFAAGPTSTGGWVVRASVPVADRPVVRENA